VDDGLLSLDLASSHFVCHRCCLWFRKDPYWARCCLFYLLYTAKLALVVASHGLNLYQYANDYI